MTDKMKFETPNLTAENVAKIAELFPGVVTEGKVNIDLLRSMLGDEVYGDEAYEFTWVGKRAAIAEAGRPIRKTLRPCVEESKNWDTTENLYIEGDNLDVLKLLQESYLGKVKMIYIDPPYNTGSDFIYRDDYSHSDWCSMMYPRLVLARNMLRDDGVIFISIDDNECHNLRKICDEVFGVENFLSVFIWEKRTSRENRKVFSTNHDYIMTFAKDRESFQLLRGFLPYTEDVLKRYKNPDNDPRGVWQSVALSVQGGHGTATQFYEIETPSGRKINPPSGLCWRYTKSKLEELIKDNRIWFGATGENVPRMKLFLSEVEQGLTPHTLWQASEVGTTDSGKREINSLFGGVSVFDTPKSVELMKRFIQVAHSEKDGVFLDFFAGSATTAHAVMQLNAEDNGCRKFIMVQLPEACDEKSEAFKAGYKTIAEISKERIRRAGKKIKEENITIASDLDIGFRVLKVDSSNMADVYYTPDAVEQNLLNLLTDNIKDDRKPEDLLFQVLLDWGVDLSLPIRKETIQGKTVFFVNEPPYDLVACFDTGVNEDLVKELARFEPLRVVFRDTGFVSDAVKINVEQIFKQMSPGTEVKSI